MNERFCWRSGLWPKLTGSVTVAGEAKLNRESMYQVLSEEGSPRPSS